MNKSNLVYIIFHKDILIHLVTLSAQNDRKLNIQNFKPISRKAINEKYHHNIKPITKIVKI